MSKRLLMYRGLPAAGKTTAALAAIKNSNGLIKRVNKDDLRAMIDAGVWSHDNENFILSIRDMIVTAALGTYDVIVDDTNLAPQHEKRLHELATSRNASFEIVDFNTPLEECIRRDAERPKPVEEKVIRDMYNKYLAPKGPKSRARKERLTLPHAPTDDPTLPYCIIVDIDGTVAQIGDRGPFEWSKVEQDEPRQVVIRAIKAFNCPLVFVSGRDGKCVEATIRWLDKNINIPYHLFMRNPGDMRRDSIIKREIYDKFIKQNWNVAAIWDDRPQVIRECWQALGFADRIFNVGTGEEF